MTSFGWWADLVASTSPGRFLCQVCFETKDESEAWRDNDGQAWDECTECAAAEGR